MVGLTDWLANNRARDCEAIMAAPLRHFKRINRFRNKPPPPALDRFLPA
jgi:hypothetical protein